MGPQGDVVVHHLGHLRRLPARTGDVGVARPTGRGDRARRVRVAARHVLRGEPVDRRPTLLRRGQVTLPRRLLGAGALIALVILAAACAPNATQDTLKPAGPYAQKIDNLFRPVFWIAVAVFVVVEGLLMYLAVRYRHRKGRRDIPPQVHGNQRLEIAWTIVPAIILVGVAIPTISGIYALAAKPSGRVLDVNVIGHQWWWEFDYPDLDVTTANVLHIPVGEPVYASLCSAGLGYHDQ